VERDAMPSANAPRNSRSPDAALRRFRHRPRSELPGITFAMGTANDWLAHLLGMILKVFIFSDS
jgi:hypothetical protein